MRLVASNRLSWAPQVASNVLCKELIRQTRRIVEIDVTSCRKKIRFPLGSPLRFGTPAYWILQHRLHSENNSCPSFTLGNDIYEETIACLLGGYGIPAEVGLAAFAALKRHGLTNPKSPAREKDVLSILTKPFKVGRKFVRYRFPRQKAARIAGAIQYFVKGKIPQKDPLTLRAWLIKIPGIGPKTASWIVRNSTGSNEVAIIDIHIRRAGIKAGFFLPNWEPSRHYLVMEEAFLAFAKTAAVPAAELDSIMWLQMRSR